MEKIAIICGTDLRQYDGLELTQSVSCESKYGEISSQVFLSDAFKASVFFMARHGTNTSIAPHQINYRANLEVLKQLDVSQIIAVNTVGGLVDDMSPGTWVIPDQIIDYTHGREQTFFDGIHNPMQHIDFSFPFAKSLRDDLIKFAALKQKSVIDYGTYAVTQGPRLETAAEIARLQNDGNHLVGMTMMPEAVLARELGIGYCSICLVANWGAGMEQQPLDIDAIYTLVEKEFSEMTRFMSEFLAEL
ncbi:MAG: S-methyl-5'-thioinosine phosphorylase [Gammaproteobacteria bacterium]|nr:S-methyl-5'-thioinosine phosphorylase [Gammaproteobacteria bacterium]